MHLLPDRTGDFGINVEVTRDVVRHRDDAGAPRGDRLGAKTPEGALSPTSRKAAISLKMLPILVEMSPSSDASVGLDGSAPLLLPHARTPSRRRNAP